MGGRATARTADDAAGQITLDYVLSAASTARAALTESLAGRPVDPVVLDEARVVVSELVTNAVQHAEADEDNQIRVAWTLRKGVVEVAVTDAGATTTPVPVRRHVLAESGRGLRIVRALAHEWGVVDGNRGRTVWASLGGPSRRRTR